MARITTRDCERFVPNGSEPVLLAAGADPLIARGEEPPTVPALRAIASGRSEGDRLREEPIGRFPRIGRDMPFGAPSPGWLAPGSRPGGRREGPSGGKAPERVHGHRIQKWIRTFGRIRCSLLSERIVLRGEPGSPLADAALRVSTMRIDETFASSKGG